MRILRFGESQGNSTLKDFEERILSLKSLSEDLRAVIQKRHIPILDPSKVPIIEHWSIETYMAPMLTGYIYYPEQPDPKAAEWLSFTAPLELLSVSQNAARSMKRWYRLGTASSWAEDSVNAWGDPSVR